MNASIPCLLALVGSVVFAACQSGPGSLEPTITCTPEEETP